MRSASLLAPAFLLFAACTVGDTTGTPGDDDPGIDAPGGGNTDGQVAAACGMPSTTPDIGPVTATAAEQRNQPGSQGARKIYTATATLPGTDEIVQVELWDNLGAFTGGLVAVGTYPLTGAELDYNTCGVCVLGGSTDAGVTQEYFATGGSVEVVALGPVGQPLTVRVSNITFGEVNPTDGTPIAGGCTAALAGGQISGPLVNVDGGGGGGGGGGGQ
jgi:hypothetical protein